MQFTTRTDSDTASLYNYTIRQVLFNSTLRGTAKKIIPMTYTAEPLSGKSKSTAITPVSPSACTRL